MTMPTYYTKKDAASRLGVSVKTLDRRIKKGELRRTIIHGPHGPEIRVLLDGDTATPDVAPATNLVADHPPPVEAVQGFAPPTLTVDRADRELAVLALRALEDMRAERDALRAAVESLRRPWWRKVRERLRRGKP
jgi:hypothetical protein